MLSSKTSPAAVAAWAARRGADSPPSDKPLHALICGRNHRHTSPEQAAECDRRYDSREAKKREARADEP